MERKRNYIERAQDWADERLRRMCGRITPGKRLAVILVMFLLFGGLSVEHIRQFPLHGGDSINPLNRPEYGRNTEE